MFVQKVRTIEGRKWQQDKKYWSFPDTDGTLEKILEVFEGEKIRIDPALQNELSRPSISQNPSLAKPSTQSPSLVKRGEGRFSDKKLSIITPYNNFEDLRRKLISRKYSYKTRSIGRIRSPLDNLDIEGGDRGKRKEEEGEAALRPEVK